MHVAKGKDPAQVVVRVYGPNHALRKEIVLEKLEEYVFAFYYEFKDLGNYIFVVKEDGEVTTVLNAKVYA